METDSSADNDSDVGGEGEVSYENLSAEFQEKVQSFIEFCGTEDERVAVNCLRQCNWDLEVAVQEFLNEKEGRPSVFSQEGQENQANAQQEQLRRRHVRIVEPPDLDGRPSSVHRKRLMEGRAVVVPAVSWYRWCYSLITLPFHFVYRTFFDILRFFWGFFFGQRPRLAVTDPEGDVRSFLSEFNQKYGTSHPRLYQGSYSSALSEAKRELKFLLVYLHSPDHQDTDRFCVETLCNPDAVQFIDQNMLFWACSVKSPEGGRVSHALRESSYPFLALICLRDNKMVMTLRQEGFCTPENLMNFLAMAIQDNESYLSLERRKREQRQFDQLLRQEQESAFQESLMADKEKEERRLMELREKEERRKENEKLEQTRNRMNEEFDARKAEIRNSLPEEPSPGDSECLRVSLKFPSGARVERRFLNSDSLELLYNVALIHDDCPNDFSLVTNFPRRVLECRPSWVSSFWEKYGKEGMVDNSTENGIPTFEEAGLEKAVMVHVQDNEA